MNKSYFLSKQNTSNIYKKIIVNYDHIKLSKSDKQKVVNIIIKNMKQIYKSIDNKKINNKNIKSILAQFNKITLRETNVTLNNSNIFDGDKVISSRKFKRDFKSQPPRKVNIIERPRTENTNSIDFPKNNIMNNQFKNTSYNGYQTNTLANVNNNYNNNNNNNYNNTNFNHLNNMQDSHSGNLDNYFQSIKPIDKNSYNLPSKKDITNNMQKLMESRDHQMQRNVSSKPDFIKTESTQEVDHNLTVKVHSDKIQPMGATNLDSGYINFNDFDTKPKGDKSDNDDEDNRPFEARLKELQKNRESLQINQDTSKAPHLHLKPQHLQKQFIQNNNIQEKNIKDPNAIRKLDTERQQAIQQLNIDHHNNIQNQNLERQNIERQQMIEHKLKQQKLDIQTRKQQELEQQELEKQRQEILRINKTQQQQQQLQLQKLQQDQQYKEQQKSQKQIKLLNNKIIELSENFENNINFQKDQKINELNERILSLKGNNIKYKEIIKKLMTQIEHNKNTKKDKYYNNLKNKITLQFRALTDERNQLKSEILKLEATELKLRNEENEMNLILEKKNLDFEKKRKKFNDYVSVSSYETNKNIESLQLEVKPPNNESKYIYSFHEVTNISSIKLASYSLPEPKFNIRHDDNNILSFMIKTAINKNHQDLRITLKHNIPNILFNSYITENNETVEKTNYKRKEKKYENQEINIEINPGYYSIYTLLNIINSTINSKLNNNIYNINEKIIFKLLDNQKILIDSTVPIKIDKTNLITNVFGFKNIKNEFVYYNLKSDKIWDLRIPNQLYLYLENIEPEYPFGILYFNDINQCKINFKTPINLDQLHIKFCDIENNLYNFNNLKHILNFEVERYDKIISNLNFMTDTKLLTDNSNDDQNNLTISAN